MSEVFRHFQGGHTEHGGRASLKHGRASNVASTLTGRSIESSPIPIGVSLKRKRGGANLNERFDRMMDSVNMISRSSTHPKPVSKRRIHESTSGSSSDPPAPETPRTVGRDFSMIKLLGDSTASMLSEDTSELTTSASMPSWLTSTLSGLQPQHPLRRLLPELNKAHFTASRSPIAAPDEETPFAFLPPQIHIPRVTPPVDSGGYGSVEDHGYAPRNFPSNLDRRETSVSQFTPGVSYGAAPHSHTGEPPREPYITSPRSFADDLLVHPSFRADSSNISAVDSVMYGADEEPAFQFADSRAEPADRPFRLYPSRALPAVGHSQQSLELSAHSHTEQPPVGDWLEPPVTPIPERGGTLALPQDPPILLEDDDAVFVYSSSPGHCLPSTMAQSPPPSLPLPLPSQHFETPVPSRHTPLSPPPAAAPYLRHGSTLSIASFISPSQRATHSLPPVDLSQLDFRWTPGPTFRPQRVPLTSPPAPHYLEPSIPSQEDQFELLDAPVTHEQSTSHYEPTSSPSGDDLAAHVRRLQRMLQSSSEAGSPARNPSSARLSANLDAQPISEDMGDEWEVVTPRRYIAGPSYALGAPQETKRHTVAPRVATPEPPTPAFAPAPGIYLSPLRGTTDADDDEDVSQVEMEIGVGEAGHGELVEEYSQRPQSRGSEHDSIESWSG
ncbi:hypothetical protein PENSPDRAFT_753456 [Peniophora sp. CONT]|nr:hypothetical protein PENSPDRAFT_753456 [Peniophora sp. CONT]